MSGIVNSFVALRPKHLGMTREILQLPDGGTIALDWMTEPSATIDPKPRTVVLLPGFENGSDAGYIQHFAGFISICSFISTTIFTRTSTRCSEGPTNSVCLLFPPPDSLPTSFSPSHPERLMRRYRVVIVNFRGYAGLPLTSARHHNVADTADCRLILQHVRQATGAKPFVAGLSYMLCQFSNFALCSSVCLVVGFARPTSRLAVADSSLSVFFDLRFV